jgi:hypothetical protein
VRLGLHSFKFICPAHTPKAQPTHLSSVIKTCRRHTPLRSRLGEHRFLIDLDISTITHKGPSYRTRSGYSHATSISLPTHNWNRLSLRMPPSHGKQTFISGPFFVIQLACVRGPVLGLSASSHVLASSHGYASGRPALLAPYDVKIYICGTSKATISSLRI